MSGEGLIACACELRREVPIGDVLPGALCSWRASNPMDDRALIALIGVGNATCRRIEEGEIEPDDELAERLWRAIHSHAAPSPTRGGPGAEAAGPHPAASAIGGAGIQSAGAPDGADRNVPRTPPIGAIMAKRNTLDWEIWLWLGGRQTMLSIDQARQLVAELGPLVAVHDQPDRYEAREAPDPADPDRFER